MKRTRGAAVLTIICFTAHGLIFSLLHFLEPQLSPSSSIISDYTQTSSAWFATSAFLLFAIGWASLSVALGIEPKSRLIFVGRILFFLAFFSIILGIAFPASMDPRTGTLLARIQNIIARPGLFLGVLLVSIGLLGKSGWKVRAPILLALGLIAFILLILTINILLPEDKGGFGQRLIFLTLYIWILVISTQTLKLSKTVRQI